MSPAKAMGDQDGDYLQISNRWARVVVRRRLTDRIPGYRFEVMGDMPARTFGRIADAMSYASGITASFLGKKLNVCK